MKHFAIPSILIVIGLLAVPDIWAQDARTRSFVLSEQNRHAWLFDGVAKWQFNDSVFLVTQNEAIASPVRRPGALALRKDSPCSGFILDLEVRCDAEPTNLRGDLVIAFGYQSPTNFHYVHLTGMVDSLHNGVYHVADSDRVRIGSLDVEPLLTDRNWHSVRLEYHDIEGTLSVFMDNDVTPGLHLENLDVPRGLFGFGSFNDTGAFRNMRLREIDPRQ